MTATGDRAGFVARALQPLRGGPSDGVVRLDDDTPGDKVGAPAHADAKRDYQANARRTDGVDAGEAGESDTRREGKALEDDESDGYPMSFWPSGLRDVKDEDTAGARSGVAGDATSEAAGGTSVESGASGRGDAIRVVDTSADTSAETKGSEARGAGGATEAGESSKAAFAGGVGGDHADAQVAVESTAGMLSCGDTVVVPKSLEREQSRRRALEKLLARLRSVIEDASSESLDELRTSLKKVEQFEGEAPSVAEVARRLGELLKLWSQSLFEERTALCVLDLSRKSFREKREQRARAEDDAMKHLPRVTRELEKEIRRHLAN